MRLPTLALLRHGGLERLHSITILVLAEARPPARARLPVQGGVCVDSLLGVTVGDLAKVRCGGHVHCGFAVGRFDCDERGSNLGAWSLLIVGSESSRRSASAGSRGGI